jgi:hypothetical protein
MEQRPSPKAPAENSAPISYTEYLALSEDERTSFPPPFLTLRWWDNREIPLLTNQSWFSQLRDQLNRGGKVSINLGILKYEQAAVTKDPGPRECAEIVRSLFEDTPPLTVKDVQKRLVETTKARVFEPSFVVLDGELIVEVLPQRLVLLMLEEVADAFGLEVKAKESARLIPPQLAGECFSLLRDLCRSIGKNPQEGINTWVRDPVNVAQRRFRGQSLARGHLLGMDESRQGTTHFEVAFPPEALAHFVGPSSFGARVLGWLEHGDPGKFFVRVIGIASVDIVRPHFNT